MMHALYRENIMTPESTRALSVVEIATFIRDDFIRIDGAFSRDTAAQARSVLWRATGWDPDDRSTWTRPVIRLNQFGQHPFRAAANTPILDRAFDQLVGQLSSAFSVPRFVQTNIATTRRTKGKTAPDSSMA